MGPQLTKVCPRFRIRGNSIQSSEHTSHNAPAMYCSTLDLIEDAIELLHRFLGAVAVVKFRSIKYWLQA